MKLKIAEEQHRDTGAQMDTVPAAFSPMEATFVRDLRGRKDSTPRMPVVRKPKEGT
jgi:hypothetical protein